MKTSAVKAHRLLIFPLELVTVAPPDVLMFPLMSAIQHRAWIQAKRLCRELILWDPLRNDYRELHFQIEQTIKLTDQRLDAQSISSRSLTTTSKNSSTNDRTLSLL